MSESKSKLIGEVERLRGIARAASLLLDLVDELYEPVDPQDLQRMVDGLRKSLQGSEGSGG